MTAPDPIHVELDEPSHAEEDCPNCIDCPGCDGGSGVWPVNYRFAPFAGGKYATVRCTDCDGTGMVCTCPCHALAAALTPRGRRGGA